MLELNHFVVLLARALVWDNNLLLLWGTCLILDFDFLNNVDCRPLIRIIGDRFPWQVKSAILSTLSIMIRKGGIALKPFLPQLQTTFVKCLQDSTRLA